MDLRSHRTALLASGRPLPILGRLLADHKRDGSVALLDPDTGNELSREDDRPAFVLSDEGEATDGHILRMFWDTSRAEPDGPGIPILWNHNADILLGQWQDMGPRQLVVRGIDGRRLTARGYFDPEDDLAQKRKGQIKRGIVNATSIKWIPGERTRRSKLPPDDPWYRGAEEDECGQPAEGSVMGSERQPNHAVEASLVSTPAQVTAVVTQRLVDGAERAATGLLSGRDVSGGDFDRLLSRVASDPRANGFLRRLIHAELEARLQATRADMVAELRAEFAARPVHTPPVSPADDFFASLAGGH